MNELSETRGLRADAPFPTPTGSPRRGPGSPRRSGRRPTADGQPFPGAG